MENKMTKKNMYTALLNLAKTGKMTYDNEDGAVEVTAEQLAAFAAKEIGLLEKKAVQAKENAAKKKAEDPLLAIVYDCVTDEFEPVAEIAARVSATDGVDDEVTVAKITYRLGVLVKEGKVEKTDVKVDKATRKAYKRV